MLKIPYLVLPLPPTDNELRIPVLVKAKGRRGFAPQIIKSPEYRDWEEEAEKVWKEWVKMVLGDGIPVTIDEPSDKIRFEYNYFLYKKSNNADDQNYEKSLRDFLSGKLYTDDRYVKLNLVHSRVEIDKENPRISLDVNPILHFKNNIKKQIKVTAI